ncbi:uncharacterized protein DNG_06409 [Cephalotrichum gorgonifer]|uniref:Heterokaryon incompatibility domain-containing protein n=1 Tax=Cephalotrichum gorgonifer TaxID=2041049 RepID=A0AAE8MZL5_9PEZI|nr:uncharacterized protein DNG_06409 [Cephalotrichum gorgonifer]
MLPGIMVLPVGDTEFRADGDDLDEGNPVLLRGLRRRVAGDESRRLYGLQVACTSTLFQLGVYADEDSQAARSSLVVGRLPKPVGDCSRILPWIETCEQTHTDCQRYQNLLSSSDFFPTRILDLQPENSVPGIRLRSGAGLQGSRYAALSHCWGTSQIIRTLKSTIAIYEKDINESALSKTFRDSVLVTRNLGLRYLWIDSLCIVQDDPQDWEREAASMAEIYSMAYVTIAASAAADGTQGLIRYERSSSNIDLGHGGADSLNHLGNSGSTEAAFDYAAYDNWYGMVQMYTARNITKDKDRLPALSGLAKAFSRVYAGQYLAGIWLDDIVRGLLWYRATSEPGRRPSEYRAPTWSWASLEGEVTFFNLMCGEPLEEAIELEVKGHHINAAGVDSFGMVSSGTLTVSGYIKPAQLRTIEEEDVFAGERISVQVVSDEVSAIGTVTMDASCPDMEILCLLVVSGFALPSPLSVVVYSNVAILLEPTGRKDEYRRVGLSNFFETRDHYPERTLRPYSNPGAFNEEKGRAAEEAEGLYTWFDDADYATISII